MYKSRLSRAFKIQKFDKTGKQPGFQDNRKKEAKTAPKNGHHAILSVLRFTIWYE